MSSWNAKFQGNNECIIEENDRIFIMKKVNSHSYKVGQKLVGDNGKNNFTVSKLGSWFNRNDDDNDYQYIYLRKST